MTKAKPAYWTHEYDEHAGHLYYFAPNERSDAPYLEQRIIQAIIDVAQDGTLAGVELIYGKLPPPYKWKKPNV